MGRLDGAGQGQDDAAGAAESADDGDVERRSIGPGRRGRGQVVLETDAHAGLLIGAAGLADRHSRRDAAAAMTCNGEPWPGPRRLSVAVSTGPESAKRAAASAVAGAETAPPCSASRPLESGKSNVSRRSPSDVALGRSSTLGGRLSRSNDVSAASVVPGTVEIELASVSVTTNRVAHRGHFRRLPALMCGGKFKTTPQFVALNGPRHEFRSRRSSPWCAPMTSSGRPCLLTQTPGLFRRQSYRCPTFGE